MFAPAYPAFKGCTAKKKAPKRLAAHACLAFVAALVTGCVSIERTQDADSSVPADSAAEVTAQDTTEETSDDIGIPTFCPTPGQLKCVEATVYECVKTSWTPINTCGDGYACEASGCVCIKACGDKTCGEDGCGVSCGKCDAADQCISGQCIAPCVPDCQDRDCGSDGCDGTCGPCASHLACEAQPGQCVESATCPDVLECQGECVRIGGEVAMCTETCLQKASANVTNEFALVGSCLESSKCETLDCVGQQCGIDYAGCYFQSAGVQSCNDAVVCANGCDPNAPEEERDACFFACWGDASQNAQLAWVQLALCLGTHCGQNPGPECTQGAFEDECNAPYTACFGSP